MKKNEHDLEETSIDILFLRGDQKENMRTIHELVDKIVGLQPSRYLQVWIENPEFIRLFNVPDDLLVKSFNDQVFVKDGCLFFRKQPHSNYIYNQHYRIVIVCPRQQIREVSRMVSDFREKKASKSGIVVTSIQQHPPKLMKMVYTS